MRIVGVGAGDVRLKCASKILGSRDLIYRVVFEGNDDGIDTDAVVTIGVVDVIDETVVLVVIDVESLSGILVILVVGVVFISLDFIVRRVVDDCVVVITVSLFIVDDDPTANFDVPIPLISDATVVDKITFSSVLLLIF